MTFVHVSSWTVAALPVSLHDCDIVSARSPGVFPGPRAESVLEHSGCVLVRAGKVPIRPARERRTKWERSSSATTSRSTGSSRTRPVTKASESGGGVGLLKDRPELNRLALDEALRTKALLLRRRRYAWIADRRPS